MAASATEPPEVQLSEAGEPAAEPVVSELGRHVPSQGVPHHVCAITFHPLGSFFIFMRSRGSKVLAHQKRSGWAWLRKTREPQSNLELSLDALGLIHYLSCKATVRSYHLSSRISSTCHDQLEQTFCVFSNSQKPSAESKTTLFVIMNKNILSTMDWFFGLEKI